MADYKAISDDAVKMTYSITRTVNLAAYKKELEEIAERLKNIPKTKAEPDQETLDFWNKMNVSVDEEIELLKRKAYIENIFSEITEAKQMPEKYIEPVKLTK